MAFIVETFGRLRLADAEGNYIAFPEKGLLLIAYLLTLDKNAAHRTMAADFLWGNEDKAVSLSNLRKTISRIKARQDQLGSQFLIFTDTAVSLDPASLTADFTDLPLPGDAMPRLAKLTKAMSHPFLGQVNCQSGVFETWQKDQIYRHSGLLQDALKAVSLPVESTEDWEILRKAGLLVFRDEPKDSDILRLLLEIFDAQEEVDYIRDYIERRKSSISRGLEAVAPNGTNGQHKVEARPAAANDGIDALPLNKIGRPAIPRLVLLPPRNLSSNPQSILIAASLIEDITIGFCAFNSLQVIAPHSAVQIGHQNEDQSAFFERHSVNYVLDTQITGFDEVKLFAQLIFFDDNQIVWAERFSLSQADLLRDRRVISRRVALSVSSEIERHEATRSYLELNPAAYHQYLVGKQYLGRLTLPNLRRARKEMRAALKATPDFAPALSSTARTYSKEWLLTARGDMELLKSAEEFATKSIEARNDLADGYREFGVAKLLQGAFDESAEAMEVAETLSPHYADVIADHADTLVHCSRPGMALQKIERAIELNPLSPDPYLWTAAGANYALGEFSASLDYISQMSDPSLADRLAAASWAMLGNKDKARVLVRRVREANPNFDVDKWLSAVPSKEQWHKDLYREGLKKAGF